MNNSSHIQLFHVRVVTADVADRVDREVADPAEVGLVGQGHRVQIAAPRAGHAFVLRLDGLVVFLAKEFVLII